MTLEIYNNNTKKDSDYFTESIKTDINKATIIPILADSIYKNPLSSIRELYFNEVTACINSDLDDKKIIITFDSSTKELTITGENSTGISKEVFSKILTTMGNSGNTGKNAGEKSGLFGLGFFSHVKISEKMIVHTRTKSENYSFISKSGISFEFLPKEFEKMLSTTGTKVILTIKDDVKIYELLDYIKEIVLLSPINTEFYFDDDFQDLKQYSSLKQYAKSQYDEIQLNAYPDFALRMFQEINDQYELIIVKKYPSTHDNLNKTFLLSAPIDLNITKELDKISQKYFNQIDIYFRIKNERDFKPHVSRDFFESKTEEKIANLVLSHFEYFIDDDIDHRLDYDDDDFKPLNIVKFLNDKDKFFTSFDHSLECKISGHKNKNHLTRHFDEIFKGFNNDNKIKSVCLVSALNEIESDHLKNYGILIIGVNGKFRDRFEKTFSGFENKKDVYAKYDIPKIKREYSRNDPTPQDITFHSYSYRNDQRIAFTVKNPAKHKNEYTNLTFVRENLKGNGIYKISDIPNLEIIKDLLFFTQDGYKTLKDLDGSYRFIQGEIFRKFKPDFEFWAYLPKYNDEKLSDLLALYFEEKNRYNGFCEHLNPYRELITNDSKFEVLVKKSIINIGYLDSIDDYNLLIGVLK